MDLKDVDLNLLVVFRQLLIERRVSRAAELLGLTQPAVSNALARLRNILGDELFVRTGTGMVPTPYANQLARPVTEALGMLQGAINRRHSFDPATSTRRFVVAMTDIGEIYFLPALMQELAQLPGIAARALQFLILTASRTGETRFARWSEIDHAERVWVVPGGRMKGGKEHKVPLSDWALAILAELPRDVEIDAVFHIEPSETVQEPRIVGK